jgi:hypothetical protein
MDSIGAYLKIWKVSDMDLDSLNYPRKGVARDYIGRIVYLGRLCLRFFKVLLYNGYRLLKT